jgi:hypothetical protein
MTRKNWGTLPRPLDDDDVAHFVCARPENPPRTSEEVENRDLEKSPPPETIAGRQGSAILGCHH